MSPFAASNFDSPLAATEEAGNDSELSIAPFAPIPEAVQLQLGNVSTTDGDCSSYCEPNEFSASQMPFLQGADGPALRIKGRAGNQSGDRGSYH